ncbi:MAG: OmpH family outer membrane protein [Desulfomonile tiedjei]|nr:OmpH family outer membrane protein [Desulfomonile tiedjei]
MKKSILIALWAIVCAAFVFSGVCVAQEGKMAFVDFAKFANASKKAQDQQKKFQDKVIQKRTELENKKKELDAIQEKIQKQGPMLKEDTRNQLIKELGIKEMELKLGEKEAQNALQNDQREAQDSFRRDIAKIISAIRTEKHLTLVFDSGALLAADDALDITDEVAKRYDAEAGTSKAPAPAAPKKPAPAPAPPAKKPAAPAK